MLRAHVKPGANGLNRVAYRRWKAADHTRLKAYLATLEAARPTGMSRDHQFAYWVNLYNAKTVDVVLDHYPVKSIRDINLGGGGLFGRGPWKKAILTVEGADLSLDDVEHTILRPFFGDARVHYAVNCASIGCPNLQMSAFGAAGLSAQLDSAAREYINAPRGVTVARGGVTASSIYDWFSEDFGTKTDLFAHWQKFANSSLAGQLADTRQKVRYAYDWGLNDA